MIRLYIDEIASWEENMTKLYTDEELQLGAAEHCEHEGVGKSCLSCRWDAEEVLNAVLPVYQQRLLKLFTKVKDDLYDRLVKENKRLKLENEKLRADLEWQQFHR